MFVIDSRETTSRRPAPEEWHPWFAWHFVRATSYQHTPTGNPAVVFGSTIMRRSIESFDLGPYRFHRYEYRVGSPDTAPA